MSETNHKPCPFCGGEPKAWCCGGWWRIGCEGCRASSDHFNNTTEAAAWAAWDRRADPARDALLAGCKSLCDWLDRYGDELITCDLRDAIEAAAGPARAAVALAEGGQRKEG